MTCQAIKFGTKPPASNTTSAFLAYNKDEEKLSKGNPMTAVNVQMTNGYSPSPTPQGCRDIGTGTC